MEWVLLLGFSWGTRRCGASRRDPCTVSTLSLIPFWMTPHRRDGTNLFQFLSSNIFQLSQYIITQSLKTPQPTTIIIIQTIYIYIQHTPTMRLDPSYLQFITKQQLRILVAIEIGMKNHQYVPIELIASIGNLRSGETYKTLRKLLKVKLIVHVGKKNNGYKLTYLGYDYLALYTFMKRGIVKDVVGKIGVGKQSDIYKCISFDGTQIVLKLTRLGRRSFKSIKNNRQYIQNRTSYNWLYLSRLSSIREYTFMQILHDEGFPTPRPIDTNRHAIVMSLIDGDPLCNVKRIGEQCSIRDMFLGSLDLAKRFVSRGLIHGDFNQFNLLVNGDGKLTVIDFPQCISSNHPNASDYFNRDIECLYTFFDKLLHKSQRPDEQGKTHIHPHDLNFNVSSIPMPILSEIEVQKRLDLQVRAKGHFKLSEEKELDQFMREWNQVRLRGKVGECVEGGVGEEQGEGEIEEEGEFDGEMEINQEEFIKQLNENDNNQQSRKVSQMQIDQNDQDIKQLIGQLKQIQIKQQKTLNKQKQQKQQQQQSSSSQQQLDESTLQLRPEWQNLTAYQIRQLLKQQRKQARQQKKAELSNEQYIKRALNRNRKKKEYKPVSKGNYGAKGRNKVSSQSIKDGIQMGW